MSQWRTSPNRPLLDTRENDRVNIESRDSILIYAQKEDPY